MPPRRVLLCSDHVPDSIVRELQKAWNCEVFEHYGMTEMGLGGGVDCEVHAGYHLREADLYFEVVDPETGEPVADGESGEVVFTTMGRRGMPFIRYRTGDISRFISQRCSCGSALRRLERVRTRVCGQFELGRSRITMADLDEALFPIARLTEFRASLVPGYRLQLRITAFASGQDVQIRSTVREVLECLPAIRHAQQAGELELCIEVAHDMPPLRAGKRRIVVEQVA